MKMSHGRSMCMPKRKAKILIVDDGSDEQTARMCDDISTKDESPFVR